MVYINHCESSINFYSDESDELVLLASRIPLPKSTTYMSPLDISNRKKANKRRGIMLITLKISILVSFLHQVWKT